MKTIILLAVTLIANFSSIAQQPDYLVKNNGDTVYGNILLLKKTLLITSNDKTEQIDYRDVKFVRAEKKEGDLFYGKFMYYDDNIYQDSYVYEGITDTMMLLKKNYSTPKMDFFSGEDNKGRKYYFVKRPQDDSPLLLMVKYVFPPNSTLARPVNLSTKKRIQIKYYVNQLKAMFNYCNKIDEWDYEALDYADYSLKKIIKRYNSKC